MKWKSHAAVTRAVCRTVGISDYHERIIIDGAIEPDVHPVRTRKGSARPMRTAHHGRSDRVINILLWKARIAFINGDEEHGCRNLGRALHYVQDKCVSYGWRRSSHDRLEEEIGELLVPSEAIDIGIEHALHSPIFIRECVRSITPEKEARRALYQATLITAALTSAVIETTSFPKGLDQGLRRTIVRNRYIFIPLTLIAGATLVVYSILSGYLILFSFVPIVLGTAFMLERRCRALMKVASWYGND